MSEKQFKAFLEKVSFNTELQRKLKAFGGLLPMALWRLQRKLGFQLQLVIY